MNIKAYLKPQCGWSKGVRAIMEKYELDYEDLDIVNNSNLYEEMVTKSGQSLSPCVDIDGIMLSDVSGDEVESYMLSNKLVGPTDKEATESTNSSCSVEEHEQQNKDSIRFN